MFLSTVIIISYITRINDNITGSLHRNVNDDRYSSHSALAFEQNIQQTYSKASFTLTINHTIEHPLLTLFTTFKSTSERRIINQNTLRNWASLKPNVIPVLFDFNTDSSLLKQARSLGWQILPPTKTNRRIPCLKHMYFAAAANFNSTFYGFSNGDILFDSTLIQTLTEVKNQLHYLNRTMVIGRRKNININNRKISSLSQVTTIGKQEGKLFAANAEDFFFIAHNDFVWEKVPDIVIGRPAYDNFLVSLASKSRISVVDVTQSMLAFHQTGKDGIKAGFKNKDKGINREIIGKYSYNAGHTSNAQYITKINKTRDVEIWHRSVAFDKRVFRVSNNSTLYKS